MPAAFQNVEEAGEVGIRIGVRIDQRVAHAGLRGEMHDVGKAMLGEQRRHAGAVGEIELDEAEAAILRELVEARLLERRIVVGVEIVEADDGAAIRQQPARHMKADEAGRAGDEDRISGHRTHAF